MIVRTNLIIISLILTVAACDSPRDEAVQKVEDTKGQIFSDTTGLLDQVKADELIRLYVDFADQYPDDTLAPQYLYSAADLMMNLSSPSGALLLFKRIRKDYPAFEKSDEALFLQAFILENYLGDIEQAEDLYNQYIIEYPDGDFADDAEISIQNLGKTPEELIREFEARQQAQDSLNAIQ